MRPNATQRNHWVQLGIGAAALLLPPLALGAAFYSMLAEPDEEATRPAVAQAAAPVPVPAPPATVGAEPAAFRAPPAGNVSEGATRTWERLPGQGNSVQTGPIQVAAAPAAVSPPPADAEGGATPPAAESPPTAAAVPKRPPVHRHARQPQPDPFPLRSWLQQIGILPRNAKDTKS